jgi:hypothetical protein
MFHPFRVLEVWIELLHRASPCVIGLYPFGAEIMVCERALKGQNPLVMGVAHQMEERQN